LNNHNGYDAIVISVNKVIVIALTVFFLLILSCAEGFYLAYSKQQKEIQEGIMNLNEKWNRSIVYNSHVDSIMTQTFIIHRELVSIANKLPLSWKMPKK
jgi:hypothetical protein